MSYLTPAQERLLIASGPDDITGEEGHSVELRGSDYRVARKLNELGLGTYTHGSPYGDLYFNNREGMELRADLLGERCKVPGCDNITDRDICDDCNAWIDEQADELRACSTATVTDGDVRG